MSRDLGFLIKRPGILPKYRRRPANDPGRFAKYLPELANDQGILAIYRGRFINDLPEMIKYPPEMPDDLPELVNDLGRLGEYPVTLVQNCRRRREESLVFHSVEPRHLGSRRVLKLARG